MSTNRFQPPIKHARSSQYKPEVSRPGTLQSTNQINIQNAYGILNRQSNDIYNLKKLIESGNIYLDGKWALYFDLDRDTYIHSPSDDTVELVLATAAGELKININGADDFTFTANLFTGTPGSSMLMDTLSIATGSITDSTGAISFGDENLTTTGWLAASHVDIDNYLNHAGDVNTYFFFSTDRGQFYIGGKWLLDMDTVALQDYVKLGDGSDVDINLNDQLNVEGSSGNVTFNNYGLGILHSSAGGLLTSSAILNGDLGNIGTAGTLSKFAATGFADSIVTEVGTVITVAGDVAHSADDQWNYFGALNDAGFTFDGTDLIVSPNLVGSGSLKCQFNTDSTAYFGMVAIGYHGGAASRAVFAHHLNMNSTDYALKQVFNGRTDINAKAGQPIRFYIGNVLKGQWSSSGVFYASIETPITTGARLIVGTATETQRFSSSGTGGAPQSSFMRAFGTESAPLAIINNRKTGEFLFRGYDGSVAIGSAKFGAITDGVVSLGVMPQAIVFYTGTDSVPAERWRITSGGNFRAFADNLYIELGAAQDFGFSYDGTAGNINSSLIAPSDINITCGANKTIELQNTVWEDLQFSISGARVPAANAPTWEALTTNHNAYSFGVGDLKDNEDNELPHWWKEGTNGKVHLHVSTRTAQTTGADRFAKFTVYVSYLNASNLWVEVSFDAEQTIPTGTAAIEGFYLAVGDLDLTGILMGTQIGTRVKRISATGGTEYADNMFITQVGIHLERDTMGSRSEATK